MNAMTNLPFAKSPIMLGLEVKAMTGSRANGSCSDISTLSRSFILLNWLMPEKMDMKMVGMIAIVRVKRTRCQRFHFKFRKPCR